VSNAASPVRLTDRVGIGLLTRLVSRDLIDEVLAETDRVDGDIVCFPRGSSSTT
jgi:hypothetical protein